MINGFFDIEYRLEQLSKCGDPLVKLKEIVPWTSFRSELSKIHDKERKSTAGRKPYDTESYVQDSYSAVSLQSERRSNGIPGKDRLSFMRFLNLAIEDSVPDARTIWLFREQLKEFKLVEKLFADFDRYLAESGFEAKKGQIIDASIAAAPKQRNSREENGQIKDGKIPKDWSQKKRSHKDTDANWVQKNVKNYFGCKNHVEVDVKHKFIRKYKVTPSSVHDSNVFEEILDKNNTSKDVFADSAYRSKESLKELETLGFREHLQRKGCKNKKLNNWEKQGNHTRSKIRSRIEHVFGVQAQRAKTLIIRTIGIIRADIKIGLRNLAYNMQRYSILAV